jgi:hypothetical protein
VTIGVQILFAAMLIAPAGTVRAPTPSGTVAQQRQAIDPEYSCVVCHTEKRRAFLLGVHSERGIRCHDCHGGDPTGFEVATAHTGADWVGPLDKIGTVGNCSSCHSDPDQMRQFGLPAGQLAEFRTSRHGMLLLDEGDANAPTCTDCHDAHTILPPEDARSKVYPTNIVRTCARCHEDEGLMAPYGLPTDQVRLYRESAHGTALFDREDFSAPTCVECHGSHAALPPRVMQITDVCGHCHVLVRRTFYQGPHGEAARAGELPGCTACHSNHGTERVSPDRIAATCTDCHAANGPEAEFGVEIQAEVMHATRELHHAEEAISGLLRAGRNVVGAEFRLKAAVTAYEQLPRAQHSLDMEYLEDLSRQVVSISRDIVASEEVSAEHIWEHKLILIPVWFLAASACLLAWFRLRAAARQES